MIAKTARKGKGCQKLASTSLQDSRKHNQQTSCAQAGTDCTEFCPRSEASATAAKLELHDHVA